MKKVLNVFKVILLLAWMIFLVLCCHSCIMKLNSTMGGGMFANFSLSKK